MLLHARNLRRGERAEQGVIDPEDIVQNVYLQTYAALASGHEPVGPHYLRRAVFHEAVNLRRLHTGQRVSPDQERVVFENLTDPDPSVDSQAVDTALLAKVLASATGPRRTTLELVLKDFSYADIAEKTGVKIGTVKSRVSRAIEEARVALKLDRDSDQRQE